MPFSSDQMIFGNRCSWRSKNSRRHHVRSVRLRKIFPFFYAWYPCGPHERRVYHMQRVRLVTILLMCFAVTQVLTAQTSSRKMRVKFSAPVEIPAPNTDASVMTLPAGTYIFKLLRSSSDRNIVQVLNEREDKVYSTILAVPDYRLNASSKTVMYFSERGAGAPSAIKSWFYPGDNSGSRFVYPKARAQAIAAAENVPIPSFSESKPITPESIAVPVQVQT